MRKRQLTVLAPQLAWLLLAAVPRAGCAQETDSISHERHTARKWFRDAKFGMFVHWGVYSLLGQGEWVMQNREITVEPYEWLASTFNPVKFDAREWVSLAKAAGAQYITITARHRDGFSMFHTKVTRTTSWTGRRSSATH